MKIRLPHLVAHLAALSVLLGISGLALAENVTVPFFVIVPINGVDNLALKAVKTDKENEFLLAPTASAVYDKNANEKTRDDIIQETDLELVQALKTQNQSYNTLFLDKETGSAVYQANDFKLGISSTIYVPMTDMKNWVQVGSETNFVQDGKTYKIDKTLLEQWGKIQPPKKPDPIIIPGIPNTITTTPAGPGAIDNFSQALFTLAQGN